MSRLILAIVALCGASAAGCAFSTDEDTQTDDTDAVPDEHVDETPAQPIRPFQEPQAPDPCETGMPMRILGRVVWLPIPCDRHWVDKGDPPPELPPVNPANPARQRFGG